MKVVICNHCGKKWESHLKWGTSEENIDILKEKEGNIVVETAVIDLCEECYTAFEHEIMEINTKYATLRKRRGRGIKKNENI